jgi:hypothetical protein
MNLLLICISSATILHSCVAQDYSIPTYNPDNNQANPTNDYNGINDPKYDNPYDPKRRFQNRNQNPYDPNQRFDNRNDLSYNQNNYDNTPRPTWDTGRPYSTSFKSSSPTEHDSLIINEALV